VGEVIKGGPLDRREAVSSLLSGRGDALVVTGLGSASYDVMAAGDSDRNYYLWASMGSAAMVGLGLANAQPDRSVIVVTGDGELMMGFGALATIGIRRPPNLTLAVLDNGHFGETGMQESHAGRGVELDRVAAELGFAWTARITDMDGLEELKRRIPDRAGTKLATIKIRPENPPRVLPPRDGVYIKNRFRAALGHAPI
jgi:thiamine pyrophosphate-dependent acetolactate synthase large subunit-like protein